jgi:hypothetical protein
MKCLKLVYFIQRHICGFLCLTHVYFIVHINKFRMFLEFMAFRTTVKLKPLEDFYKL